MDLHDNNNVTAQSLQCIDDASFGIESDDGVVGLVPYGFNSDSDNSFDMPVRNKKRKKRAQVENNTWLVAKNKNRRECGKSYWGRKKESDVWNYKKIKVARAIKARCKCAQTCDTATMKCALVTDGQRQQIFKTFWKMDWKQKKVYVNTLVQTTKPSNPRNRTNPNASRRVQTLKYHLKVDGKNLRVCRIFFLNTLCIGRCSVLSWVNKPVTAHNNVMRNFENNISEEKKDMNLFFDSLPVMESHYCRAVTQKKYLLPEWRSKQMLYDFYSKDWCATHNVRPLSLRTFHSVFESRNLGLFAPKKDQCEICARYSAGTTPLEEYSCHQEKKEEARMEKNKDRSDESNVFTVDLQAVLMAPKSQVSSLYYRTKLQVHNLVFFNIINKKGYCFLWNEAEGGVNAEDFASIWVYFIETKILPSLDNSDNPIKIIFYSDGCGYQNRNCVMSNALLNTAIKHNIVIEQKILEPGHTQMEADSVHSTIERAMKNKNIDVPAEYIGICKAARKKPMPYDVTYLTHDFFKKFNNIEFCKSIRPGRIKGDAKVTDIRALKYTPNREIFFKLRFTTLWKILPQRIDQKIVALKWCNLEQLYQNRIPIKRKKYEDLQYLKLTLPKDHHQFYDDLLFE